jgi:hypothetical protein
MQDGKKFDTDKPDWSLLPIEEVDACVQVMTYGKNKYNENPNDPNWKKVEDGYNRYYAALLRHLVATRKGEYLDPESGHPHMAHVIFNALTLSYFTRLKYGNKRQKKNNSI